MADQRAEIIRLLELLGIADLWHVIRPLPGEVSDKVLIQNESRHIEAVVPLTSADLDDPNFLDAKKITLYARSAKSLVCWRLRGPANRSPATELPTSFPTARTIASLRDGLFISYGFWFFAFFASQASTNSRLNRH